LYALAITRDIHSFPTRRSSDLVRAHGPQKDAGERGQHFVAGGVPACVIDVLEPVDVQEDQRDLLSRILLVEGALHVLVVGAAVRDRKSTRLNSSHGSISYAVFC